MSPTDTDPCLVLLSYDVTKANRSSASRVAHLIYGRADVRVSETRPFIQRAGVVWIGQSVFVVPEPDARELAEKLRGLGPSSRWRPSRSMRSDSRHSGSAPSGAARREPVDATRSEGGLSRRKPLGPAGFRARMGRTGTAIGLFLPVVLLVVNAGLGYGGILVTIVLLVWIATGILLTPTPDEER